MFVETKGFLLLIGILGLSQFRDCHAFRPTAYECDKHSRCVKTEIVAQEELESSDKLSLGKCKLTCGPNAQFWPLPRKVTLAEEIVAFDRESVELTNHGDFAGSEVGQHLERVITEQVEFLEGKKTSLEADRPQGILLSVKVVLTNKDTFKLTRNTNESYELNVDYYETERVIRAEVQANNYFGARHGIETLFQMVEHDDIARSFVVISKARIQDYPEFPHRGVTLDTSRNFIEVDVIKRILDGMAHSKLNVFHWHIVDTHSFPVELKTFPVSQMTQYGAYSPKKIYSQDDIRDLVKYATFKGVRIIPELDQPAHVGNGWQFPEAEGLTVCLNQEPWYKYCVEPPCGQLNPHKPKVYDYLEMIYTELQDLFDFDSFHMGADEVNFGCWNSTEEITAPMLEKDLKLDEAGFIEIWRDFQQQSSDRLKKVAQKDDLEIIVWNSRLTNTEYLKNLPPKDYTVQLWSNGSDLKDPLVQDLVNGGYNMIFSNYDSLYLDCGNGAWVGEGNNWCSPYKEWQKIYQFDPVKMLTERDIEVNEATRKLIRGAEVALWTEQVDSTFAEGRIFPRAAALAERLWSYPATGWYAAQDRMLQHRFRLVQRGVRADRLQPEWCRLNEGQCYGPLDDPREEATSTR